MQRGIEKRDGVEVLRWRIDLPSLAEYSEISAFYGSLSEGAAAFCQNDLTARAMEAYDVCDDPKKRFRFAPFVYELAGRITQREEGLLSVELCASLLRGGQTLSCRSLGQIFDLSEQILLSPEMVARMKGIGRLPRRLGKRVGCVLILDGALCMREGDAWVPVSHKEKKTKN